jgi:hypothetical protein
MRWGTQSLSVWIIPTATVKDALGDIVKLSNVADLVRLDHLDAEAVLESHAPA